MRMVLNFAMAMVSVEFTTCFQVPSERWTVQSTEVEAMAKHTRLRRRCHGLPIGIRI